VSIDTPLPAAPLLDRLSGTVSEIAEALGVTDRTIQRWRATGIDPYLADEIAIKHLGMHPAEIWGTIGGQTLLTTR
jgi:Homeodomain-like domain